MTPEKTGGVKYCPKEISAGLVRSFDNDPLYKALIEVCIRRGFFRVTDTGATV